MMAVVVYCKTMGDMRMWWMADMRVRLLMGNLKTESMREGSLEVDWKMGMDSMSHLPVVAPVVVVRAVVLSLRI